MNVAAQQALPPSVCLLRNLGAAKKGSVKLSTIFKKNYNVSVLSLARGFLFGSRDLWFEVGQNYFFSCPHLSLLRNPAPLPYHSYNL